MNAPFETRDRLLRLMTLLTDPNLTPKQKAEVNEVAGMFLKKHWREFMTTDEPIEHKPSRRLSTHGKVAVVALFISSVVTAGMGSTYAAWGIILLMVALAMILLFEGGFIE